MLLTGSFQRNLDEKYRFAIPKRIRDALDPTGNLVLYMAPGTDGSLVVYTEQAFAQLGQHLGQGPPTGQDIRAFQPDCFTLRRNASKWTGKVESASRLNWPRWPL